MGLLKVSRKLMPWNCLPPFWLETTGNPFLVVCRETKATLWRVFIFGSQPLGPRMVPWFILLAFLQPSLSPFGPVLNEPNSVEHLDVFSCLCEEQRPMRHAVQLFHLQGVLLSECSLLSLDRGQSKTKVPSSQTQPFAFRTVHGRTLDSCSCVPAEVPWWVRMYQPTPLAPYFSYQDT